MARTQKAPGEGNITANFIYIMYFAELFWIETYQECQEAHSHVFISYFPCLCPYYAVLLAGNCRYAKNNAYEALT
jgi:hypothetical protein